MLLALDTSDFTTGVALLEGGQILEESVSPRGKNADLELARLVREILRANHLDFAGLDAVAISAGPGSFTGLRVGTAYTKGICYARGLPLLAVASLEALAHCAPFTERLIVPLIHARGDEIYYAGFEYRQGVITRIWGDSFISLQNLRDKISHPSLFLGSGYDRHREQLLSGEKDIVGLEKGQYPHPVRFVAKIAEKMLRGKIIMENIYQFEPKYLQDFPRSS